MFHTANVTLRSLPTSIILLYTAIESASSIIHKTTKSHRFVAFKSNQTSHLSIMLKIDALLLPLLPRRGKPEKMGKFSELGRPSRLGSVINYFKFIIFTVKWFSMNKFPPCKRYFPPSNSPRSPDFTTALNIFFCLFSGSDLDIVKNCPQKNCLWKVAPTHDDLMLRGALSDVTRSEPMTMETVKLYSMNDILFAKHFLTIRRVIDWCFIRLYLHINTHLELS